MRTLRGQRRINDGIKRNYKVKADGIERNYCVLDWKEANNRFNKDYPEVTDYEIYVEITGYVNRYRKLKAFKAEPVEIIEIQNENTLTRAEALYELSFRVEGIHGLENFVKSARKGNARITRSVRDIISYIHEGNLSSKEIEAMKVLGLYNKEYRLAYGYND